MGTEKSVKNYDKNEIERKDKPLNAPGDKRDPFEKDRARIIHSAAFRRLQGKTQVFGMGGSDFFRTRLTHSLEAAQIGKGIAIQCGHANHDLVEAACLAHDIGHPPFGHTGETVLKERMKKKGGFEGNAQNLRILAKLEIRTAKRKPGLNLTRGTIDAILKYKKPYKKVDKKEKIEKWKFYYDDDDNLVRWASKNSPSVNDQSFECQIMNWADDIAYSTHDLEDGMKAGMISSSKISSRIEKNVKKRLKKSWDQSIWNNLTKKIETASDQNQSFEKQKGQRRDLISNFIHIFVKGASACKRNGKNLPSRYQYSLKIDPKIELECKILKKLVWELIIDDEHVATLERKATKIVNTLFDEFTNFGDERTTKMYPLDFREKIEDAKKLEKYRIACDYIAGMTDTYAVKIYGRLTGADSGTLMDII